MKKNLILLVIAALWPFLSPKAQNNILNGTVTGTDKNPLAGATVQEQHLKKTAQTNSEGKFSLTVSQPKGNLTVSYLGYQSKTLTYTIGETLSIQLTENPNQLQAVEINTGYYSVKQKQLTGSISSLKAEQIEKQPIANPILALQGRITGAYITQQSSTPGAAVSLLIRGQNSIDAGSAPLYLVDGVPYGQSSLASGLSQSAATFGQSGSSPFASLSPDDIASIDILKDADATAIYGSRGANGVVRITTKKGKSGKTTISLNSSYAIQQVTRRIAMLHTQDFLALRKTAFALDGVNPKATDYDSNGTWDPDRYTNWQNELLGKTASSTTNRLSLSGGNENTTFLLSVSQLRQGNIVSKDHSYGKASGHLAASHHSIDRKLSASASLTYSTDNSNLSNPELTARAVYLQPNAPALYNPDGSWNWANSTWVHPLRVLENRYLAQNKALVASSNLSYQPIKNLTASLATGYTISSLADHNYIPVSYYDPAEGRTPATSVADYNASSLNSLIAEPQLSYSASSKYGNLSILAGYSYQRQQREQLLTRGVGYTTDAMIENIRAATTVTVRDYSITDYRYSGLYGRIGYTVKDRYILNLTARRDGSSRFGAANRLANFGAVGLAYLASETGFVQEKLPFISLLKIRGSYGTSGNDQIGDYEYLDTYAFAGGYNTTTGLQPLRLYNPDFAWEKSRKLEFALEFGLFKDRLRGQVAYYRTRSGNQLIDYPLPATTGFTSLRNNLAAAVQNSGLELELSASPVKGKLSWETSLNLTVPRNKLLSFPGLSSSSYANTYVIGRSLSIGKAYQLLGVDPATGVYTYADLNGDGSITPLDRRVIMERGQSAYGGLHNSFFYKGFSLDFLFQFVAQRSITFNSLSTQAPGGGNNQPLANQGKYWTQPGDIAQLQRPTSGANAAAVSAFANYYYSTAATGDASFIRLKNLSFSYSERKLLPGKTIRLYLQGQNLWTITDYFGLDPEYPSLVLPPQQAIQLGLQLIL